MKTEDKLGKTLKELMVTEPLDTITVKRLSTLCGINRQTFYYHFRDIYDLLTWIFLNESVHGVDQCKSWQEVFNKFLDYVDTNIIFIQNTLNSAGRELFKDFMTIIKKQYAKSRCCVGTVFITNLHNILSFIRLTSLIKKRII